MRTTIAIATFLAVGAGAAGVSALNLKGSDTLKATTLALLHDATLTCGGVGNSPAGTLDYDGTGSGNGQAFLLDGSSGEFVAPMSRALNNGAAICTNANRTKAEGIVFELDGISIVAKNSIVNETGFTSCNGANSPSCTPTAAGLAFSGTIPLASAACTVDADCNDPTRPGVFGETCSGGQCTYSISGGAGWKQVLRILFFGFSEPPPASGNTSLAHRNCVSPERKALQASYYQVFQSACAGHDTSTAACTSIQHLWRRNDESGTSDLFIGSVNAGAIGQQDNTVSFCNAGTVGPAWGTEVHSNGDTCTPPSSGCSAGATCVTANNGIHHCEARSTCTTDADCGTLGDTNGFITTGGCTANDADCRGVPAKACSNNPVTGGSKLCMVSRLFLACNTDTDCGSGLTGACVPDAASLTGKSCIKGKTGQLAASTFDAFMPTTPVAGRVRNPLFNITEDPEATNGYRGEYFTDLQDRDTLRVACNANEDVCSARGDLGLLLPIYDIPADAGLPTEVFPTASCVNGRFICSPVSQPRVDFGPLSGAVYEVCADGTDPNKSAGGCAKGFCPVPVTAGTATPPNSPICAAGQNSNLTLRLQAYNGKVYNLTSWKASGSSFAKISLNRATGFGNPPHVLAADSPINMVGAFYKIHSNHTIATGASLCKTASATEQIGCLVQASPCSLGYAGNSAASVGTDAVALKVNQIDPNNLCVQNFLTKGPSDASTYRLSRRLYLNTLNGFENLSTESSDQTLMANCFANGHAGDKATGLGFIPLPATIGSVNIGSSYCEDFNEQSICGDASNVDACKAAGQTNPAPIPGCEINLGTTPPTADDPVAAGCSYGVHF